MHAHVPIAAIPVDVELHSGTDRGQVALDDVADVAVHVARVRHRSTAAAPAYRAGVAGLSETIHVRSIIGRFLEHSRVYYFHNDGKEEFYCSSADWMDRNFFRRNETCFPIKQKPLKERLWSDLQLFLADNTHAWILTGDGTYERLSANGAEPVSAQQTFLKTLAIP